VPPREPGEIYAQVDGLFRKAVRYVDLGVVAASR
jgi:hypothetical protein